MTLTANSSGVVAGKFTVPAGVIAGTKEVVFTGAGGSKGLASYTGIGQLLTEKKRLITRVAKHFYDPVAETFTVPANCQIASIDLWFSAVGTTQIKVDIREVDNGVPTQTILGTAALPHGSVNTTTYTRFSFDAPIALQADVQYAIVVQCDDAVSQVWTAVLGQWDLEGLHWVTSQPYQVGVLLTSSNAATWTPSQSQDLTFRLNKAVFTETNHTFGLGSVSVAGITDLLVLAVEESPAPNTYIVYTLTITDTSGPSPVITTMNVVNMQPVQLPSAVTGTVAVAATLYGDATASPILFPDTQLVVGTVASSGTYVSHAFAAAPPSGSCRLKVILDAYLPTGATLAVQYNNGTGGSWSTVPFVSSVATDDGFVTNTYQVTGITSSLAQVKLTLNGTTAARPIIKNLRAMTA